MAHISVIMLLTAMPLAMGLKINGIANQQASIKSLKAFTFKEFVNRFSRAYQPGSTEWSDREAIFNGNMEKIVSQRQLPNQKWKAGINNFLDWTEPEKMKLLGHKGLRQTSPSFGKQPQDLDFSIKLPKQVDLSVNPKLKWSGKFIRDQGACGSCWAVAVTATLEAHMELVDENAAHLAKGGWYDKEGGVALSSQNIVSCTPNLKKCGGSGGCDGATAELAYDYVKKKGIQWGLKWLYTSGSGESGTCNHELEATNRVFIKDYVVLPSNSWKALMVALSQKGPVTVAVAATNWFNYESGVFDACRNDQGEDKADFIGNHAVVAFGYGEDNGEAYWLIKNSWGPSWGENGFIRLTRAKDEKSAQLTCGMDTDPEAGSACKGETAPVKVCGHCGILYDMSYPVGATVHGK